MCYVLAALELAERGDSNPRYRFRYSGFRNRYSYSQSLLRRMSCDDLAFMVAGMVAGRFPILPSGSYCVRLRNDAFDMCFPVVMGGFYCIGH